ncbi:MAG: PAS domain-containing protein [Candidatus Eisenbacteria bacterium]|nr:PAS domain-containing protein [Candidatus Eisenbacteria bacterium]
MTDAPPSGQRSRPPRRASRLQFVIPVVVVCLAAVVGGYQIVERTLIAQRASTESLGFLQIIRGVVFSLLLAGLGVWYLLRRSVPVFPSSPAVEAPLVLAEVDERARQHARWFVHARWVALGVILGLILIAGPLARMLPGATLVPLLAWWVVLLAANLWFHRSVARVRSPEGHIMAQAVADLVVLTGLLNASGGIENPLYLAYMFHVIIAAVVLPKRKSLAVTAVALSLFLALVVGESADILPHYTNQLFPHASIAELAHQPASGHEDGDLLHAAHDPLFVTGEAGSFVLMLLLASWLTMLVTDRLRHSEARLERTARSAVLERKRLESVVHSAKVGMILLDPDLTVRWVSQLASEWLEWDASVIGRRCPLYAAAGEGEPGPAARVLESGRPAETERAVPAADGSLRYFRHIASPVRDGTGRVVQVVELVEDVTMRRALEAEALHAGKMSVLGRMAAGIAHEIGNPLSSMAARLRLMEQSSDAEFLSGSLALLQGQVDRIGRIVHGVSEFARVPRREWTTLEVNAAVEEAMSVAELDPRVNGIVFRRAMAAPSPLIRGVRDQVVQVVLNLLLNAAEATSGRGTIAVETSRRQGEVAIAVQDSGVGMDEQVRTKLFEPFFTTKPRGTGLGLSISYALVHAHGGRFQVESEPGRGARFVVLLPAAEAVAAAGGAGVKR